MDEKVSLIVQMIERVNPTPLPVRNIGMDTKNPPTAQALLRLDFCRYLLPLPPSVAAFTNFTAKRNWMAQTSRQHKFRDRDKAHRARVTS